jgi:putative PEP-CTERM system TPR-repeat lipoprotein
LYRKTVIALVVSAAFLFGCTDYTKEELLTRGVKMLDNNPDGAVVLFKNALEKDQNYLDARLQLAKAYVATGKPESAERELKKVLRQTPASRDAHVALARVYLMKSMPEEALKELSGFVDGASEDHDVLLLMGEAHARKGDYAAAEKYFKTAISVKPESLEARVALAMLYMEIGKTDDARLRIEEVLDRDPHHYAALNLLANLQVRQGEVQDAVNTYERLVEEHPGDVGAAFRLGLLKVQEGHYDEAISLSEKLIEMYPKRAEGHELQGMGLFHKKDYESAVVALQKAVAIRPSPGGHYYLGLAHLQMGEYEQALSQMYEALDQNPRMLRGRIVASLILFKQGRVDDCIDEAKRAIEMDETQGFAHNLLGSAYIAKGMIDEGMAELNRALELNPGMVEAHMKKGLVNLTKGKTEEALADLQTAVQVAPEVLNSRLMLASYYMNTRQYGKAEETLVKGIRGDKRDAVLYNLLAETQIKQGRVEDAISSLQKAKSRNPDGFASYFKLATIYLLRGQRQKGMGELKEVVQRSPDNVKALLGLARLLESRQKESEALDYYRRAAETGLAEGQVALAYYHLRNEKPEKALEVLDNAISVQAKPDVRIYALKGRILVSLGRYDAALKDFEEMSRISPSSGLPYIVQTYIAMKKPQDAMRKVNEELEENPDRLDLKAEVSRLYWVMGQRDKAIKNAERLLEDNPKAAVGYLVLAKLYEAGNRHQDAVRVLQKAEPLKSVGISMMLGTLHAANGEDEAALEAYRKAETLKPGYVPAIFQQGAIYQQKGEEEKTIELYSKVLRLSANHVPALNNLAYLYADEGKDLDTALRLALKAYLFASGEGSVLDTLGYVLLKSGKEVQALKVLEKAAETASGKPTVLYHLALAYKKNGDVAEAVKNLERALESKDFPDAQKASALLAELKGDAGTK